MAANKYTNVKTFVDGILFDSRLEAKRYIYLKNWQNLGLIQNLQMQTKFDLSDDEDPDSGWNGRFYKADFCYTCNGKTIVEDVKCSWTSKNSIFRAKKQRMLSLGMLVKEVLPQYIKFLDIPESLRYKQSVISKLISSKNSERRIGDSDY